MKGKREHAPVSQMGYVFRPEDAELWNKGRLALADLAALYELRRAKQLENAPEIRSPQDAYDFLRYEMEDLEQEQLRTINLNAKSRILSSVMIYQGSVHTTVVRIAEIFRPAVIDNATAIIIAHNHPSGSPDPSPEDCAVSRDLVKAGKLLGIDVLDHIVIGKGNFVSLKERGLGFDR
jgi:DNA repair protein RadC